jgi:hypothetical protein
MIDRRTPVFDPKPRGPMSARMRAFDVPFQRAGNSFI